MPKAAPSGSRQARRHNPLTDDILATGPLRTKAPKNRSNRNEDETGDADKYIDSKQSRKILSLGQDLAEEESAERQAAQPNKAFAFDTTRFDEDDESDEEPQYDENDVAWGDEEEEVEEVEIDPNDLEMFNKFMPSGPQDPIFGNEDEEAQGPGTNLTELILEKIAAHEAAQAGQPAILGGGAPEDAIQIPAKVVEVYTKIGLILSRYRSGKLPKPFKILPTLPNWEDIMYITRPDSWTPNACYEATRIFVSSKPATVQRFMETVILERVRDDIHETKKLNVHLFNALKKALYKPAAFFKGFLFPLVGSGTCTLREAHIVASVLSRVSIPVLHSAAALLRLCDIAAEQTTLSSEGGGATNIFIRVLLEKKYALPFKVIDGLVFHFLRFRATDPAAMSGDMAMSGTGAGAGGKDVRLPVLWHQCLLAFAQRYRNDITEDQREALLDLLLVRGHKDIGPEVRRELLEGRGRGVAIEEPTDDGGDDTMMTDNV